MANPRRRLATCATARPAVWFAGAAAAEAMAGTVVGDVAGLLPGRAGLVAGVAGADGVGAARSPAGCVAAVEGSAALSPPALSVSTNSTVPATSNTRPGSRPIARPRQSSVFGPPV